MPLGAVLGAGLSALGSIFGGIGAKKAAKQARQDFWEITKYNLAFQDQYNAEMKDLAAQKSARLQEVVGYAPIDTTQVIKDAEELGINPISYIRSGALNLYDRRDAFARYAEGADYEPSLKQITGQPATTAGIMTGAVGNAISGVGSAVSTYAEQTRQNNQAMELLNAQLKGVQTPGAYSGSRSFYVPSATLSGPVATRTGGRQVQQNGGSVKGAATFKNAGDTLFIGGVPVHTDPWSSNAEDWETRYGDVVQEIAGLGIAASDVTRWAMSGAPDEVKAGGFFNGYDPLSAIAAKRGGVEGGTFDEARKRFFYPEDLKPVTTPRPQDFKGTGWSW